MLFIIIITMLTLAITARVLMGIYTTIQATRHHEAYQYMVNALSTYRVTMVPNGHVGTGLRARALRMEVYPTPIPAGVKRPTDGLFCVRRDYGVCPAHKELTKREAEAYLRELNS